MSKNETVSRAGVSKAVSRSGGSSADSGDGLSIPYASIIRLIPNELWGKLAPAGVAGYSFVIPRSVAQTQLASGAVKVKFGDIRKGVPAGVFIDSPAEDNRMVELPLSEILMQMHPDAYARRPDQARVEVTGDVPDVFGNRGGAAAPIRVMEKKKIANTTIVARQKTPESPAPQPVPANVTPFPATAAPPAPIPIFIPTSIAMPAANPTPAPAAARPASTPLAPLRTPASPVATLARPLPKLPTAPAPTPAASGFAPMAPAIPLAGPLAQGSFTIGLGSLAENWPDSVRKELAALKIPDARMAIPPVDVCEGLKRGRIQYPWRVLRSWIQPTPLFTAPSPNDDLVLELPLRTLTPAFLEFIRSNPVNRQTAAAENITEFFRRAEQSSVGPDVLEALSQPEPEAAPAPPPPAHAVAPAPAGQSGSATLESGRFCIPLAMVSSGWPEAVGQDIATFGLAGSRIDIPVEVLDASLKGGKLEFGWTDLCAWLNPPSTAAQVSIYGDLRLTLPLSIIGPLFIKLRPAGNRKKKAVMADIPDLFNGGKPAPPEPPAVPAVAEAPASTPAAVPAPVAVRPRATNISELFGEPGKKSWTPNEIVQRAMQLPGVAGALIALQDGLLVASSLPPELKTEMIAAFVPQIFGRLNQYSKELGLGDTSATGFTIEAGIFQIYNAGIIYFAALGRKGESLPVHDLQLIAAELSRYTK